MFKRQPCLRLDKCCHLLVIPGTEHWEWLTYCTYIFVVVLFYFLHSLNQLVVDLFIYFFFYSFAVDSLSPFPTLQSFWSVLASKQPQFKLIKQFGYTGTASPYSKNSLLIFAIKYHLYLKNQTLIDFLFFQKQTNNNYHLTMLPDKTWLN